MRRPGFLYEAPLSTGGKLCTGYPPSAGGLVVRAAQRFHVVHLDAMAELIDPRSERSSCPQSLRKDGHRSSRGSSRFTRPSRLSDDQPSGRNVPLSALKWLLSVRSNRWSGSKSDARSEKRCIYTRDEWRRVCDDFSGIRTSVANRSWFGTRQWYFTYEVRKVKGIVGQLLFASDLACTSFKRIWVLGVLYAGACLFLIEALPTGIGTQREAFGQQVEYVLQSFQLLAGFVIGGYVNSVVDNWEERREQYCAFVGATRMLIMHLAAAVIPPPDATPDEVEGVHATRETLARWVLLGVELSMAKARGVLADPRLPAWLDGEGLLHPGEWQAMVALERHNTVWYWINAMLNQVSRRPPGLRLARAELAPGVAPSSRSSHVPRAFSCAPHQMRNSELLSNAAFGVSSRAVANLRNQAQDMRNSIELDLPYPYVMLCRFFVELLMLVQVRPLNH